MAYNVKKINPLDLQPRKAIGVSLPFSGGAVFNSTYQTEDAIRTNLINYFLTGKKERFMNPLFGNALQELLFDEITQAKIQQVDAIVRRDLEYYFPRVQPIDINVTALPDENIIQFSMTYKIQYTDIQSELVLNLLQ